MAREDQRMKRRPLLVVAGWLVVALVATGAGVVITTFLGESISGSTGRVLSSADVRRQLGAAPPASGWPAGTPSRTGTPSPGDTPSSAGEASPRATSSGPGAVFSARGGVVVARCAGGLVTLLTWTPAPGYEVKDAERGPRDKARVRFEAGDARTEIQIRCSGEQPVSSVKYD
jgi:hypothetical protein